MPLLSQSALDALDFSDVTATRMKTAFARARRRKLSDSPSDASTSSDIHVAPKEQHHDGPKHLFGSSTRTRKKQKRELATVENGRMLIIRLRADQLRRFLNTHLENGAPGSDGEESEPNAKGTYSKKYTLRHPETIWTHRGQGRYLPLDVVKKDVEVPVGRPAR